MTERTFSIIKPDATRRNLTGKVNAVIEDAGLRIVAQRRIKMTDAQAKKFYEVHAERPFYGELVEFMTSAPVVVQVLEGENAVAKYRGPGRRRHDPQAVRRERRRELGARLGQPRERQARNRPVLHGRRHRRLSRKARIVRLRGDRSAELFRSPPLHK
jgi:nucleoside-diphosphate kinase